MCQVITFNTLESWQHVCDTLRISQLTQSNSFLLGRVCIAMRGCVQFSTVGCVQSLESKKKNFTGWMNLSKLVRWDKLGRIMLYFTINQTVLIIQNNATNIHKWDTFKRLAISLSLWLRIPISQMGLMSADGLPSPKDVCRILLSFNATVLPSTLIKMRNYGFFANFSQPNFQRSNN